MRFYEISRFKKRVGLQSKKARQLEAQNLRNEGRGQTSGETALKMGYDFWITMGTAAILASIKNVDSREQLKRIMLKLFLAIRTAYAGDPDFI